MASRNKRLRFQETAIKRLLKAGYTLIELNGKVPIAKAWQMTPYDKGFKTKRNYGVLQQSTDLVIDCDPRNYPPGRNSLAELIKDYDLDFSGTFIVRTGAGGLHVYLKNPTEARVFNEIAEYPGVEFKSGGRQVVGPFSMHPKTKKPYTVRHGKISKIMDAPANLIERITNENARDKRTGKRNDTFHDDSADIKAYLNYLRDDAPLAVEGQQGDKTTFTVAANGKDRGLSPDVVYTTMLAHWNDQCDPSWDADELHKKVYNAFEYSNDEAGWNSLRHFTDTREDAGTVPSWSFNKSGRGLKASIVNVVNVFLHPEFADKKANPLYDLVAFNAFTRTVEYKNPAPWHKAQGFDTLAWAPREFSDKDIVEIKYWLSNNLDFEPPNTLLLEGVTKAALKNTYHPVKDWLNHLEWDGEHRLDTWLTDYCGAANNSYVRAAGVKTLCAAVARVYSPGIKFDHMLVLEGIQGVGKSTLVTILGGEWYADVNVIAGDKDTVETLRGKWLVEASEMECVRRSETNALKAFISRQVDRMRQPYARLAEDFPRQCIIIGTINPDGVGYLKDTTGNRRFWPVFIPRVDMRGLKLDREQLFAEAKIRFEQGEKLFLNDRGVHQEALHEADKRAQVDPWMSLVIKYVDSQSITRITPAEVYTNALDGQRSKIGIKELARITKVMQLMGWEQVDKLVWEKPDKDMSEFLGSL